MQPRTERGAARRFGRWRDHAYPAARTTNGKGLVSRHARRHRGQLDLLEDADDLRRNSGVQADAAARARLGTMLDDGIGMIAQHPAVALVIGLSAAELEVLALLLAIRRERLG